MKKIAFSLLIFLSAITTLKAEEAKEPGILSWGAGVYNIVKYPKIAAFQLEYLFSKGYYKTYPFTIRPMVGAMMTVNYTTYIYGGVHFDLFATKNFVISPSFAPGLYFKGKGKDLHYPLEFRSSMEIAYVLKNKARIGAQFYHISNASLGKKNPGVEALMFFVGFPI